MHYCIASQNKGVLFIILLIIIINIIISRPTKILPITLLSIYIQHNGVSVTLLH